MAENLGTIFKETAQKYPQKTAIQWKKDDKWIDITYETLAKNVDSLSTFLLEKDIKEGDRVAIILENRPEWPVIFFGAVSIGAVLVPINPEASQKEIDNILKDSQCKLVFNHKLVESDGFKNAVMQPPALPPCNPRRCKAGLACILYTSGTTDEPKGVMLSHKNLISNCESLSKLNLITQKDSIISVLPLHHAYPLTVTMILPLLRGGKIIYPGSVRGEVIAEAMRQTDPTVFVAVPQIFYAFHEKMIEAVKKKPFVPKPLLKIGIRRRFGKALRFFVSGGAKLDAEVAKDLFKFGLTILEGYGLTETAPVLTMNPLEKPKIGSVGLPIPDVELKLTHKDEKGIGEVVVRGPNIMDGYYKRADLTADVIKDGWFHTGDLGYIDEDGYLFLTGRSKDVIVLSSGLNIYPEEIEEAYSKEAPLKEMCVFEMSAKTGIKESEVLWAVVVPDLEFFRKYGEVNLKHVIKERFDNVSRTLPPSKRLMGFSITLDELPHTLLGKVKRFEVKEIYIPKIIKEEEALPVHKELSEEDWALINSDIGKRIIDYLKKQTRVKGEIVPGNTLEIDLGIDSLGRIELASGLEKVFNTEIKDEVIGNSFTVRDLILGISQLATPGVASSRFATPGVAKPVFDEHYWRETLDVLPKKENLDRIDLNPSFGDWLGGFLFTLIFWIIFKIFYNLRVEGQENLPKSGPYILYVNHTSYLDGLVIAASLPRFPRLDLFFVGFRPYFDVPIIRNLIKIGRIIPLDFSSHLLEALRGSFYVLKNKRNLCLFPEGLRTLDGTIGEFKIGFGILAKEAKAKLVPVYIDGAFQAWPRTQKFPKRHPIRVKFDKAIDAEAAEEEGLKMGAKDGYSAICISARKPLIYLKPSYGPTRSV